MSWKPLPVCAALMAAAMLGGLGTAAAEFPERTVTMVVPSPPGGPTDTIGRIVADGMSRALGQPVVIENVAGASGTVGSGKVARSKPDGYTLLFFNLAFSTTPAFMASIPYDPQKDFEPIGLVNSAPFVVISRKAFDASSTNELFQKLKKEGRSLNFAHGGVGGGAHLCAILLGQRLGVDLTIISYKGAGPALTDVISGQVDLFCAQATDAVPQLKAGTIKAFATTGAARIDQLPELPTLEEVGLAGTQIAQWHAVFAPKGTPPGVIQKLNAALRASLDEEAVKGRLEGIGSTVYEQKEGDPKTLANKLDAELKLWKSVAQKAGISPQ